MSKETSHYELLTTETAIAFIKEINYFSENEVVTAEEIRGEHSNLVFRIKGESQNSVIVKQALPNPTIHGRRQSLTLDRARIESESLKRSYQLVPEYTPNIYYHDAALAVTVMDDLSHLQNLQKGLNEKIIFPRLARDVGTFLAHTLFFHSNFAMAHPEKKLLEQQLYNPELSSVVENSTFNDLYFNLDMVSDKLHPFFEETLLKDNKIKKEFASLKNDFLTKTETLLHGNFDTINILVNEEETYIINPELAQYGPIGYDIGTFLAAIITTYLSEAAPNKNETEHQEFQDYLTSVIIETWNVFDVEFGALWQESGQDPFMKVPGYLEQVLEEIFHNAIGFAGCMMINQSIRPLADEEIESSQLDSHLEITRKIISLGKSIVLNRKQFSTINQLIKTITEQ
ncbi:S-methyl-5-thioribose kinase [Bacillus suaedae]|uniref:S-methyl-5-thioribose kinase n=1 Tax=Halalkalibacter suaedae TaxID=2822140 RepID=A0A940WQV6_9BACI|nr:S-methyl-5-thioribose kinase [Bacillus suaedae]MBP3951034.1 S-methyl-5-thioribose kinase [Bacillus suaedae]